MSLKTCEQQLPHAAQSNVALIVAIQTVLIVPVSCSWYRYFCEDDVKRRECRCNETRLRTAGWESTVGYDSSAVWTSSQLASSRLSTLMRAGVWHACH